MSNWYSPPPRAKPQLARDRTPPNRVSTTTTSRTGGSSSSTQPSPAPSLAERRRRVTMAGPPPSRITPPAAQWNTMRAPSSSSSSGIPRTTGRRLSDASFTPTMPSRLKPRGAPESLMQVFGREQHNTRRPSTDNGNTTPGSASHIPSAFPGSQRSSEVSPPGYVGDRRPESRNSVRSVTSAHTYMSTHTNNGSGGGSGSKAAYFVKGLKLDAKIVPPPLGHQRARRRKVRFEQEPVPRVRVRMEALVHVLHQGEQCVDLLCIGDPQDPDEGDWPTVERAEFSLIDGGADYAESVITSPGASPRIQPQSLTDEWVSQMPELDATPMATPVLRQQHQPGPKRRITPVFHVREVSPYPPPPPALTVQHRANGDSRLKQQEQYQEQQQQQQRPSSSGSSHYESHTQASYSRARARATDRVAIYGQDHSPVMPSTLSRRRSMPFNENSPFATATPGRPASVMGTGLSPRRSLADMFRDPSLPGGKRAHSSMGFANHSLGLHPIDNMLSERLPPMLREPPSPGIGSQWSQVFGGSEGSGSSVCVFDTDEQRGVFVARIREPRRVRISVWFTVPALAQAPAGSSSAPAVNGHTDGLVQPSASTMTIFPWESGSVTLSGLPRSLNTRVCIRLPHRRTLLGDSDDDTVLLNFSDTKDASADMLTTPQRRVMKVDMSDAPSTMRRAGISRGPLPELSPQGLPGDGCFYRIRMSQPSRSEPTSSRVMDARLASSEALGRKGKPSATSTGHGWLSTDDSDSQPSREGLIRQLSHDADLLLDRRLQRHIDETADDLATYLPPVGVKIDDFGSPQPVAAKIDDRQQEWDLFAQDQAGSEGFDYSKTELTTFKLKSIDMITLAWSPRLVEYCQPLDEPPAHAVLADHEEVEQLVQRRPVPPPAELFGLETIMSASSTPNNSMRARSGEPAPRLSTDRVFEALAKPVAVCEISAAAAVVAGKPAINGVDVRVRVNPQSLGLLTRVVLSLESVDEASAVVQWPESVVIDFAALQLMIPGSTSGTSDNSVGTPSMLGVGYQHKSVTIESNGLVQTPLWAVDKSNFSSLHVWIPSIVGASSSIVFEVESSTRVAVSVCGMQLTDHVWLAIPEHAVTLSTAASSSNSVSAKVTVDNASSMWVSASLADHDTSVSEALSAINGVVQEYAVVDIARQGMSQSPSAQHLRLVSALSDFGASDLPCICPSQLDIDVSMAPESPLAASGLTVTVTLVCTLTSLDPWFVQMQQQQQQPPASSSGPLKRTACLAIRTPAISDSSSWVLDHVNVSSNKGGGGTPIAPLVTGSQTLVVLPIRTTPSVSDAETGTAAALGDEVLVDTVKCVFSASVTNIRYATTTILPLPLPLLDMGDSSGDIDKLAHVRFARRSKYLLSSTRLSLAVPSLASGRMAQPAVVSTDTVSCPIDLSTDSTLLATHRLYLSLENSLALQLYTPEPPKELVARYVETDPIVSEVVGKLPSSKDSAANLSISLSASEADDEEEAEDISPATTASGSPRIIELDESGDQGADGQEQHQREPATETDALLGEGASRSARTERQQQEQSTGGGVFKTLWRTIKNIFTMLIYLTATVVLLYVAAEYFEMQSPPPLPERGVQQQQQLVTPVLLPSEPAAMQPPTSLFSESTSAAPPLDMTLLMAGGDEVTTTATMHQSGGPKVRVRSKARVKLPPAATRGGAHSNSGAQGAASLDSTTRWWIYSAVVEPVLEFIRELW